MMKILSVILQIAEEEIIDFLYKKYQRLFFREKF